MMKINCKNYEIFLIDYLEGKLNITEIQEVESFLRNNPEIASEFEDMQNFKLEANSVTFPEKATLKRNNMEISSFEKQCISRMENDMTAQEAAAFDALLLSDEKKKIEFELFTQTKLIADKTILFPQKNKLRKGILKKLVFLYPVATAAAIILLFFNILYRNPSEKLSSRNSSLAIKEILKNPDKGSDTTENELNNKNKPKTINKKSGNETKTTKQKKSQQKQTLPNKTDIMRSDDLSNSLIVMQTNTEINFELQSQISVEIPYYTSSTYMPVYENESLFIGLSKKFVRLIKVKILHKKEDETINFWDIAEAGVQKINKLTESDIALQNVYDKNGKLLKLGITSSNFELHRDIRRR